ncbi:hypothetical protein ACFX19_044533 [Malus domestica]
MWRHRQRIGWSILVRIRLWPLFFALICILVKVDRLINGLKVNWRTDNCWYLVQFCNLANDSTVNALFNDKCGWAEGIHAIYNPNCSFVSNWVVVRIFPLANYQWWVLGSGAQRQIIRVVTNYRRLKSSHVFLTTSLKLGFWARNDLGANEEFGLAVIQLNGASQSRGYGFLDLNCSIPCKYMGFVAYLMFNKFGEHEIEAYVRVHVICGLSGEQVKMQGAEVVKIVGSEDEGLMQEPDIVKIRFNFHWMLKVMEGILVHDQGVSSVNCSSSGIIYSISNLFIFRQNEGRWIVISSINYIDSMFGDDEFFIMPCDNNLVFDYKSVNFDFVDVMNDLALYLVVDMSNVNSEEAETRKNTRNLVSAFHKAEVGFVSARPKTRMMSPKKRVCEEDTVKAALSGGDPRATVRAESEKENMRGNCN